MTKSFCLIILSFCLASTVSSQLDEGKHAFRLIGSNSAWMSTSNPVKLLHTDSLSSVLLELEYMHQQGALKSVFNGLKDNGFNLQAKSYRQIGKTRLFGQVRYKLSSEKDLMYSNVNDASMVYPYLLLDTMGLTSFSREGLDINGIFSSPLNDNVEWGGELRYTVNSSVQSNDPRPLNKVMNLRITPGILWNIGRNSLGFNAYYAYYNEDINANIVKENTQYAFFQHHGLGVASFHKAGSYNRLYAKNTMGLDLQHEFIIDNSSHLSGIDLKHQSMDVDDGRKATEALWAAVKNDASLKEIQWKVFHVVDIKKNNQLHRIKVLFFNEEALGKEYIQRLEKIGTSDLEHWVNYAEEDKYGAINRKLEIKYKSLKRLNTGIDSELNIGAQWNYFKEEYYLPKQFIEYQNMTFDMAYLKVVGVGESALSFELKGSCRVNMNRRNNIIERPLTNKITLPEYDFKTTDIASVAMGISYESPYGDKNNTWFIASDINWFGSVQMDMRTSVKVKIGVVF